MITPHKRSSVSSLCALHQATRNAAVRRTGKFAVRAASTVRTVKLLAFGVGLAAMGFSSAHANTQLSVPTSGTTDLTTLGATSSSDLTFTSATYTTTTFTLGSTASAGTAATAALTVGTLDDLDATQTLVINPAVGNGGTATLTLSGGSNSVAPNTSDLLYVASGGTLTINALNTVATTNGTLGVALGASGNFDVAGTSTVSAVISGTGFGITKTGAGTLTLSGLNTYTGGTTASAGTLLFGGTGTTTSGAAGTGTLTLNGGSIGAVSTGGGIANAVAVSTATQIGGTGQGTLTLILGSTLTGSGNLTLASNFVVQGGNNTTFNGSGYTGTLTVNSGVTLTEQNTTNNKTNNLNLSAASVALNGTITYAGGGTNNSAAATYQFGSLSGSGTIGGVSGGGTTKPITLQVGSSTLADSTFTGTFIASGNGTNTLTKTGTNKLTLTGTNTYTGNTNIQNGSVSVSAIGNSGSNGNVGAGTTITFGAGTTTGTLVYTGTGETTSKIVSLSSTGTGGGVIDQSGTGALVFSAFATPAAASHTLTLQGSTAGTGEISAAIVDNSATNKTSVTKAGTGTWTLSNANTYTGTTTVNGGTLLVNGSTVSGSAVTVNGSGAVLGGTGTVSGTVGVTNGTILAGAATSGVGTASATGTAVGTLTTGALTLNSNSTFSAVLAGDASFSKLAASGTTALAGAFTITLPSTATFAGTGEALQLITSPVTGTFSNSSYSVGGYTFTADYTTDPGFFDVDVTPVPEPATWAGGLVLLGVVGYSQRRRFQALCRAGQSVAL